MVQVRPQPPLREHVRDAPARLPIEVLEQERRCPDVAVEQLDADVEPPEQHGGGTEPDRRDGRRRPQSSGATARRRDGCSRSRATAPTTTTASSIVAVRVPAATRRHRAEDDQVATVGAAQTAHARPHQPGAGGERQPIVEAAGEVRVALRDEGDDRRRGEADPARPAGQLRRQQVREHDAGGGEGDVGEAHQQQPAVRTVGRLGEPDQRGDGDVVQRRVVGHPHGAVAAVPAGPALDLPLRGAVRDRPAGARSRAAGSRRSRGRSRGAPSRRSRRTAPAGRRTSP